MKAFADRGGPVLGICNGFQVLLEAGLLPGAMVRNDRIKFVSQHRSGPRRADRHAVHGRVRIEAGAASADRARRRQLLRAARSCSTQLEANRQVIFRYTERGRAKSAASANPNGSLNSIAGICNRQRNVVGLMPHPERASEAGARQRRRPRRAGVGREGACGPGRQASSPKSRVMTVDRFSKFSSGTASSRTNTSASCS